VFWTRALVLDGLNFFSCLVNGCCPLVLFLGGKVTNTYRSLLASARSWLARRLLSFLKTKATRITSCWIRGGQPRTRQYYQNRRHYSSYRNQQN
jgi:hypothetical protein